jgi:hypothetical protein
MNAIIRSVLVTAALGAISACGSGAVEERATEAEQQQALRDSAFGALVEPMDRAAEVQQLQLERKREIDAALDQ